MRGFRRKIETNTWRALLAKSGNKCAFPNCNHPLFNNNNLFVSQLCHIEAISPEGPRFNSETTEAAVNSFDNLILLCYRHHKETDDATKYDVVTLKQMKHAHEEKFKESNFGIDEQLLETIANEMNDYWDTIDKINANEHVAPDFKIEIEANAEAEQLIEEVWKRIEDLDWASDILRKELKREYFELVCLALPNSLSRLKVLLQQLEIKMLESKLKNDPKNGPLKDKLESLKGSFKETAKHAGLAD